MRLIALLLLAAVPAASQGNADQFDGPSRAALGLSYAKLAGTYEQSVWIGLGTIELKRVENLDAARPGRGYGLELSVGTATISRFQDEFVRVELEGYARGVGYGAVQDFASPRQTLILWNQPGYPEPYPSGYNATPLSVDEWYAQQGYDRHHFQVDAWTVNPSNINQPPYVATQNAAALFTLEGDLSELPEWTGDPSGDGDPGDPTDEPWELPESPDLDYEAEPSTGELAISIPLRGMNGLGGPGGGYALGDFGQVDIDASWYLASDVKPFVDSALLGFAAFAAIRGTLREIRKAKVRDECRTD